MNFLTIEQRAARADDALEELEALAPQLARAKAAGLWYTEGRIRREMRRQYALACLHGSYVPGHEDLAEKANL